MNVYGLTDKGMIREANEDCIGISCLKNGITIKDIYWSKEKGYPVEKAEGQDFILDEEAHALFSNGDKYIIRKIEFDENFKVMLGDIRSDVSYIRAKLEDLKER